MAEGAANVVPAPRPSASRLRTGVTAGGARQVDGYSATAACAEMVGAPSGPVVNDIESVWTRRKCQATRGSRSALATVAFGGVVALQAPSAAQQFHRMVQSRGPHPCSPALQAFAWAAPCGCSFGSHEPRPELKCCEASSASAAPKRHKGLAMAAPGTIVPATTILVSPATTPSMAMVSATLLASGLVVFRKGFGRQSMHASRVRMRSTNSPATARDSSPIFATIMSLQQNWKAAVAEIAAEAKYKTSSCSDDRWDFGVLFVKGYDASVIALTKDLDLALGMRGKLLGVAVEGTAGTLIDGAVGSAHKWDGPSLQLVAAKLPPQESLGSSEDASARVPASDGTAGIPRAIPFFIGKKGLQDFSYLVMRLQAQVRVRGAEENPTTRAWREFLGTGDCHPNGILLFVDPLASKYVVKTVLAGLDLAFPRALKFGGVCADLPPTTSRLAVALADGHFRDYDEDFGVAGLLLPSCVALHGVSSPSSVRVGPELRVTRANGQIVSELNDVPAAQMLAATIRDAGPLNRVLIKRSGILIGMEAPRQPLDGERSQVYDDIWGSSNRAPSYAELQRQATSGDWLVRSVEPLPDGSVVIRREDLKRVPPRVGPAWLRCQLHVHDDMWARDEFKLSLQRYLGARMMLPYAGELMGVLVCACSCRSRGAESDSEEWTTAEMREVFGEGLPMASVATNGEISPPGVSLGGSDKTRTTWQGHTTSCCFLTYEASACQPSAK
mmetsp:Transcript_48684/g.136146  ORF Transcript_48684/g.136146 Transcript_48684/m.136146 type:complete len:728 (-) Transcript_48684:78-2261(-)